MHDETFPAFGGVSPEWITPRTPLNKKDLPDPSKVPYFGDLPNFTDLISKVNFWGLKSPHNFFTESKLKTKRQKSEVGKESIPLYEKVSSMKYLIYYELIHFIRKGLPMRCQVRRIIDAFEKIYKLDPSFLNFIKMIFLNTSLGLYPHCIETPNFECRVAISELFIYPENENMTNQGLLQWIRTMSIYIHGKVVFSNKEDTVSSSSSSNSSSNSSFASTTEEERKKKEIDDDDDNNTPPLLPLPKKKGRKPKEKTPLSPGKKKTVSGNSSNKKNQKKSDVDDDLDYLFFEEKRSKQKEDEMTSEEDEDKSDSGDESEEEEENESEEEKEEEDSPSRVRKRQKINKATKKKTTAKKKKKSSSSSSSSKAGGTSSKPNKVYHYQATICFMIREFIMNTVGYLPHLREVLQDTIHWEKFESNTLSGCEKLRTQIRTNMLQGYKFFVSVEEDLTTIKRKNIYAGKKFKFSEYLLEYCQSFNINKLNKIKKDSDRIEDEKTAKNFELAHILTLRMCRLLTTLREQQEPSLDESFLKIDERRKNNLEPELVSTIPKDDREMFQLLCQGKIPCILVGLIPEICDQIVDAKKRYDQNGKIDVIKNLIKNDLGSELIKKYPNMNPGILYAQYCMMFHYYRCQSIVYGITKFTQPKPYYEATILALRQKFKIPNTTETTEELLEYFRQKTRVSICINCYTIRSPVVTLFSEKVFHAIGNSVLYDIDRNAVYCVGQETTASDKKRSNTQGKVPSSYYMINNMNEVNRRIERANAKKDYKFEHTQLCNNTLILNIDILGYFLDFNDNIYMLCSHCASLTIFDKRYPYFDLYTCGCCKRTKNQFIENGEEIQCFTCQTPLNDTQTKIGCYIVEIDRRNDCKQKIYPQTNEEVMRHYETQQSKHPEINMDTLFAYINNSNNNQQEENAPIGEEELPDVLYYPIYFCNLHNKKTIVKKSSNNSVINILTYCTFLDA